MIRKKEATLIIANFGKMPMFQGKTNQPTQRMTV